MAISYTRAAREYTLSGFSGRCSVAVVEVVSFDRTQRVRRAWLGLATWWSVAAATAFIPVAHFVLVPGFVAFGLYSFSERRRAAVVALAARGTCPDCEVAQDFDVPSRWTEPVTLSCTHCGRSLRLAAVGTGAEN